MNNQIQRREKYVQDLRNQRATDIAAATINALISSGTWGTKDPETNKHKQFTFQEIFDKAIEAGEHVADNMRIY